MKMFSRAFVPSVVNESSPFLIRLLSLSRGFVAVCVVTQPLRRAFSSHVMRCAHLNGTCPLIACCFSCLHMLPLLLPPFVSLRCGMFAMPFCRQYTKGVDPARVVEVLARLGEAVGEIGLAGGQVSGE